MGDLKTDREIQEKKDITLLKWSFALGNNCIHEQVGAGTELNEDRRKKCSVGPLIQWVTFKSKNWAFPR